MGDVVANVDAFVSRISGVTSRCGLGAADRGILKPRHTPPVFLTTLVAARSPRSTGGCSMPVSYVGRGPLSVGAALANAT